MSSTTIHYFFFFMVVTDTRDTARQALKGKCNFCAIRSCDKLSLRQSNWNAVNCFIVVCISLLLLFQHENIVLELSCAKYLFSVNRCGFAEAAGNGHWALLWGEGPAEGSPGVPAVLQVLPTCKRGTTGGPGRRAGDAHPKHGGIWVCRGYSPNSRGLQDIGNYIIAVVESAGTCQQAFQMY